MPKVTDINADRWLMTWLIADSMKEAVSIWNRKHPNDDRPNKRIESIEAWLAGQDENAPPYNNMPYDSIYATITDVALTLKVDKSSYSNDLLQRNLSFIIDYKIKHNQSFGDFEAVFEAASEVDKEKLLFHMDLNNA